MRFKVAGVHREFFEKNGYIEFESVLKLEDLSLLTSHTDEVLQKRIANQIEFRSPEELYRSGRDVWRSDATLRKQIFSHSLAHLAADLFKKPTLHIAFDQLLRTGQKPGFSNLLPSSLQSISSIQPIAGAVLIHLSGPPLPSEFVPSSPENVMFLSSDLVIPWELFFQLPHQSYLLIAYAPPKAIYVLEKKDPHTHALKKLGYAFGDRLQQAHHPIVFRN